MKSTTNIAQESWFDPFSTKRPAPEAAPAGHSAAGSWAVAASLIDPGDDPSDDPDMRTRG